MKSSILLLLTMSILALGCRQEGVKDSPPVMDVNAPRPTNITTNVSALMTNATNVDKPQ
jgi:hypothetical protein